MIRVFRDTLQTTETYIVKKNNTETEITENRRPKSPKHPKYRGKGHVLLRKIGNPSATQGPVSWIQMNTCSARPCFDEAARSRYAK